jgi:arginase family enzyme
MDERIMKIWYAAEMDPEFHISGDLEGLVMKRRIYGDTPSFMEAPIAYTPEDLEGADVVFVGLPWEGGIQINSTTFATTGARPPDPDAVISRSGAYQAPAYIREYSIHYSLIISDGYYPDVGEDFCLSNHLRMMDYSDVDVVERDVEETTRRAVEKVGDIVKAGAIPLVFGGDHSTPYPIVKAISDNLEGKIGVINFDSHYDIGIGGRLNAGNAFGKIMENCQAEPENLVIIGIKGGAYNTPKMHQLTKDIGATLFTIADVERMGIQEVVKRAVEIAGKGTERIYVTLDSDAMDPATFPAQKYPDPFGLSALQVRDALRMISRESNLCGFDLVCVGPAYDHKGIGGLTACRFYIEVLQGLALRKVNTRN